MSKVTQNQRILDYIKENGSITPQDALRELGVMRLASRISDLKKDGYAITSVMEKGRNRFNEPIHYKRYSLEVTNG